MEKALLYEISRQKEALLDGGQIVQETRLWDPAKNKTTSMRGKEEAHDYRYFPDPDLLPLVIDSAWIQSVEKKGLVQITDTDAIDHVVADIISNNPKEVEAYKNGRTKLLGFFVER